MAPTSGNGNIVEWRSGLTRKIAHAVSVSMYSARNWVAICGHFNNEANSVDYDSPRCKRCLKKLMSKEAA